MAVYWLQLTPFIALSALMAADEFLFHRKRGLPLWERLGHPVDTVAFLSPLAFELFIPFGPGASLGFIGLACLSCILVAKDELVHQEQCRGAEQFLHAYLFMLHPLVLLSAYFLWPAAVTPGSLFSFQSLRGDPGRGFLTVFMITTGLFGIYQLVYWNLIRTRSPERKEKSIPGVP